MTTQAHSRRLPILPRMLAIATLLATFPTLGLADKGPAPHGLSPEAALQKMMAGNARFVAGRVAHPRQGGARRTEVAKGQTPFAIVIGCSDSRTSPEIVFDQGLGDVFVTRLAGNIVDDAALGSVEFGVAVLGASIIVVVGHESCGAVKAAIAGGKLPGKIGTVVKPILPAVAAARKAGNPTLESTTDKNSQLVAAGLQQRSTILRDAVQAGKLKIVASFYDLDSGRVRLLQ